MQASAIALKSYSVFWQVFLRRSPHSLIIFRTFYLESGWRLDTIEAVNSLQDLLYPFLSDESYLYVSLVGTSERIILNSY